LNQSTQSKKNKQKKNWILQTR